MSDWGRVLWIVLRSRGERISLKEARAVAAPVQRLADSGRNTRDQSIDYLEAIAERWLDEHGGAATLARRLDAEAIEGAAA